nr:MAG: replication-associated protein [Circoviridae sp.]
MPVKDRVKALCFTINNYTAADHERLVVLGSDDRRVSYLVFGFERGESGTRHIQGYISLSYQQSFEKLRKEIGGHLERSKGSANQNRGYCSKDGNFTELGTLPEPGRRNDLHGFAEALRSGKRLCEVASEDPSTFIKFGRGIRDWMQTTGVVKKRNFKTYTTVYIGPVGSGKSSRARLEGEAVGEIYDKPSGPWWDGYDQQPAVVMDDFYGTQPYHILLNLLDRYPLRVAVKGAYQEFTSTHIWITSNVVPRQWYDQEKFPDISGLMRRIDKLVWIGYEGDREVRRGDGDMLGACGICSKHKCACPVEHGEAMIIKRRPLGTLQAGASAPTPPTGN